MAVPEGDDICGGWPQAMQSSPAPPTNYSGRYLSLLPPTRGNASSVSIRQSIEFSPNFCSGGRFSPRSHLLPTVLPDLLCLLAVWVTVGTQFAEFGWGWVMKRMLTSLCRGESGGRNSLDIGTVESTMPIARPAHYIGRVGALAVFLGIGALISVPGVAAADTDGSGDSSAAVEGSAPAQPAKQARSARGTAAGHAVPRSAVGNAKVLRGSTPQMAAVSDPGTSPIRLSTNDISDPVISLPAVSAAGEPGVTPSATVIQDVAPAAAVSAELPTMVTAESHGALSGTANSRLAWLGGSGDPSAPIAAPLAWAGLAVSRRDIAGTAITVSPAAVPTTGEPPVGASDSALTEFVSQPDVTAAIAAAAKRFVIAIVGGENIPAALGRELRVLNADPLFRDLTLDSILAAPDLPQAVGSALTAVVTGLAADSELRAAISDQIGGFVTSILGDNPVSEGVAGIAAGAVTGLLADPATAAALGLTAGSFASAFLSQPGVVGAVVDIADELRAAVAGSNAGAALDVAWQALQANSAIQSAFGAAVSSALNVALTDVDLVQALGVTVTNVISDLANDPALQAFIGQNVVGYLVSALAGDPIVAGLAPVLGDLVTGLVANSAVSDGLANVVGGVLTTFFGQPFVAGALSDVGGQIATALLIGTDPAAVIGASWQGLQANSQFASAVAGTIAGAVSAVLANTDLVSALGTAAAGLVGALTNDPTAWSFIGDLAGSTYGDAIVAMLADPEAAGRLAQLAVSAVTGFLGKSGVPAALSDTTNQLVASLLAGTSLDSALQGAVLSLQSNPAIQAALDALISGTLSAILGDPAAQQAVSTVVEDVINNLVTGSSDVSGLAPVAGKALKAAVDSLIANTAVQNLIGNIGADALGGGGVDPSSLIQAVITQPALQGAVGAALGEAVGSLFGDNLFGAVVSGVVGFTATFLINVAAGIASLLSGLGIRLPGAAAATSDSDGWWILPVAAG